MTSESQVRDLITTPLSQLENVCVLTVAAVRKLKSAISSLEPDTLVMAESMAGT